ncbi:MAG TPA: N-acetyl-gamma-glutamyl-phosphate reductase [Candidatus Hydrogenedens sp.]|nr:N-acetyl-gamma-glutamyl-phosphate reductase [Candidatus Hydrogenedens sp.]HOL18647.1 N-acetyl-gamma-glutamyl-phosphate reductase [Candidatus Hydrogenedens sp.]HPP57507.1 N-acetyl-gamma-glutamyl-phosphate reductase [Candidatus Hydrogenedens sp.]
MIRVGLVGAIGFAGREFIRLLLSHPDAKLVCAVEMETGKKLQDVLPNFRKLIDLELEPFDADSIAKRCDVVFFALPAGKSMPLAVELIKRNVTVMDLGSDFRIKDAEVYVKFYKMEYTHPELLKTSVYGLVPWYREEIKKATLVAVPGCFPISAILPLRPLVEHADPEVPIVIDSISGISGAGRGLNELFHFPNMNENMRAYRIGNHQHIPEIEQEIGGKHKVQFTPHVASLTRGILTTITLRPTKPIDPSKLYKCYEKEPFVRVLPEGQFPEINYVRNSNFCDIGWMYDSRTGNIIIVSAIDNLVGGTAGMGLQCLNVRFGFSEDTGLRLPGMMP